jgi:hypothetical protein
MNRTGKCSIVAQFFVGVLFLALGMTAGAQSRDEGGPLEDAPVIFDVRRSLPMEPDEPTYHDFYISAGIEAGLKKGQFLPVARQMPVHDPIANKQQAMITIPVGKLQVIHVENNIAVARLVNELRDDERPTLEFESVMIGDRVDVKRASMEAPKENEGRRRAVKRKSAGLSSAVVAPLAVSNAEASPVSAATRPEASSTGFSAEPTQAPQLNPNRSTNEPPTSAPANLPDCMERNQGFA